MKPGPGTLLLVAITLSACGPDPQPAAPPAPKPLAGLSSSPSRPAAPPQVSWTAPAGWKEGKPTSDMRVAQFDVATDAAGDPVQCIVFGGLGGSDDDNIARWVAQMGPGAREKAEIGHSEHDGVKVTRLAAKGSYTDSMRGEPKAIAGATMLAAVVETAGGKLHVKLVGDSALVDPAAAQFDAFLASIRPR